MYKRYVAVRELEGKTCEPIEEFMLSRLADGIRLKGTQLEPDEARLGIT